MKELDVILQMYTMKTEALIKFLQDSKKPRGKGYAFDVNTVLLRTIMGPHHVIYVIRALINEMEDVQQNIDFYYKQNMYTSEINNFQARISYLCLCLIQALKKF